MGRKSGLLGVLLLVGSLAGCNLCQSPFDYSGSVIGPNGFPNCQFRARWNSAFEPIEGSPSGDTSDLGPTPAEPIQDSMNAALDAETAEDETYQMAEGDSVQTVDDESGETRENSFGEVAVP